MFGPRDLFSYSLLCFCVIGPLPRLSAETLRRSHSRMARGCTSRTINDGKLLLPTLMERNANRNTNRTTKYTWTSLSDFVSSPTSAHTDSPQKEYTTACIRETLRVLPSEPRISKDVHKDTVLPGTYFTPGSKESPSVETGKFLMAVPAGSVVVMDIWALHMSRESCSSRTREDPYSSRRAYPSSPRHSFVLGRGR